MTNPFIYRHGRRYLRSKPRYALPVDIEEMHRQSLNTLMLMRIHGAPFCNPFFEESPPAKVLEIACGTGFWSAACHDYFKTEGFPNVSFTGADIVQVAPDLKLRGMNWRFVQLDLHKHPLPFPDNEFDFIFIKDADFNATTSTLTSLPCDNFTSPLIETLRLLKPGGVVEIWETDWTFRTLLPHPSIPPGTSDEVRAQADETGTYLTSSSTGFTKTQNRYLSDCNAWMEKAANRLQFAPSPCALTGWTLQSDPLNMHEFGSRRLAIPFGEVRWERDYVPEEDSRSMGYSRDQSVRAAEKRPNTGPLVLNSYQASLRRTALTTTIQLLESLEPILMAESGKLAAEYEKWFAGMAHNLLEENGTFNGECLETGAWWAQKK
jgi:ubiquinone/menaquinone biosynthesis C-methylase UbiE